MPLLSRALLADPVPTGTFGSLAAFRSAWAPGESPFDAAVLGGLTADRLGYAFAAGYTSALRQLVPTLDRRSFACLCVTESAGAHPRAIRTALGADGTLTGHKQWTTLASEGQVLLVAARTGPEGERPALRVARVRADAPGIVISPMPPTPFAPEIGHSSVTFAATPIEGLLPGDGWDAYVKPFRTVEDIHVSGAALGYLLRVARTAAWPPNVISRLVAAIVALRGLADAPPDDPTVHVALGGVLDGIDDALRACESHWASAAAEVAERWRRDAPLLGIAGRARAARLAKAWEGFEPGPVSH